MHDNVRLRLTCTVLAATASMYMFTIQRQRQHVATARTVQTSPFCSCCQGQQAPYIVCRDLSVINCCQRMVDSRAVSQKMESTELSCQLPRAQLITRRSQSPSHQHQGSWPRSAISALSTLVPQRTLMLMQSSPNRNNLWLRPSSRSPQPSQQMGLFWLRPLLSGPCPTSS